MKEFTLYDAKTGELARAKYTVSDESYAPLHVSDGFAAIEGHHDHRTKRVDIASGEIIDREATPPAAAERRAAALARIEQLEASQPRALRELALGRAEGALTRLKAIEDEITALRKEL